MRINISKSKNNEFIYLIKDFYSNKSRTTKIVEKLGRIEDLCKEKQMSREEVILWAKNYAKLLTEKEKNEKEDNFIPFLPNKTIAIDDERSFNCGYLFIQKIYYDLNITNICRNIKEKYKFDYDINAILSDLIYTRTLHPSSKSSSYDYSKKLLEKPKYKLHDVYRALDIIGKENAYIQSNLYKNSHYVTKRNTSTLYYDCTNYYFEIEEADGLKQYGKSKENRPNPIIGMGLMMDGNGLPLAFDLYSGNKNEQVTLKPLEKRIIEDFELSKFIYCSDAGLASKSNKLFNSIQNRAYIITQSLKKLNKADREIALKSTNFKEIGKDKIVNLKNIDFKNEDNSKKIFFKEIPLENPVKERLIITYSPKYATYQKKLREQQINRAINMLKTESKLKKTTTNPNSPLRFIERKNINENGEKVKDKFELSIEKIMEEEMYDGLYAITTNLEDDDIAKIISVTERRWQIEECFRIMKTDFKARPVYLQKENSIKAHFLTCFISLLIYRLLSEKLNNEYTVSEVLNSLRNMYLTDTKYNGYIPSYKRTKLTDRLHEIFGFRTDFEIISKSKMRNIIKTTKTK